VLGSAPADQQYCDSYSIPVTFTSGGKHLLRVTFSGDSNVNGSYGTYNFPVGSNTSSYVSLSSDVTSVNMGGTVTFTAQIGSDVRQYAATGTVTFMDAGATLATKTLDGTGTATLAVNSLAAGTHNITANYSGDSVLQASSGGPATVSVADYAINAQPTALSIPVGQSGTATLTILPLGGSTQTIQVSCGQQPVNLSCSFTPASVTLDGATPASVKITVTARTTTAGLVTNGHTFGVVTSLAFAAMLLPFWRRRRLKTLLGLTAILAISLYGAGCSSSSSSPNAAKGMYVLNITATSNGGTAKTTPLVVNIQ